MGEVVRRSVAGIRGIAGRQASLGIEVAHILAQTSTHLHACAGQNYGTGGMRLIAYFTEVKSNSRGK